VEKSLIFKFSSSSFPIVIAAITARESHPQLFQITDKMISDPLKRVPGVGSTCWATILPPKKKTLLPP
jgi:multidrug efflux pump subunit AcrB